MPEVHPSKMLAAADRARRRLQGKQQRPLGFATAAGAAMADEGWGELTALGDGVKRKYIHWAHSRADAPTHKQPSDFTRAEF